MKRWEFIASTAALLVLPLWARTTATCAPNRFQNVYAPEGASFAAYIGFYTPCNTALIDDEKVSAKPIRLYHGIADDWVPIGPCRVMSHG